MSAVALRNRLLDRKGELLNALRLLERDRLDGVVDSESYESARARYEVEAANILERLDAATDEAPPTSSSDRRSRSLWLGGIGAAAVLTAMVVFLVFVRAAALAPSRPEAATMHALVLGGGRKNLREALRLLHGLEVAHPTYSRAWFVDGLLSSRRPQGYSRAIAAYRRFLMLEPRSPIVTEVKTLLAAVERAQRGKG
jgi:hypothetical protein